MNPCRQRGFSAPPKRFMYRLHKQRISTFFTLFFFPLAFFFIKKRKIFFSLLRIAGTDRLLWHSARDRGGWRSAPPGLTFYLGKNKIKNTKKKNHTR